MTTLNPDHLRRAALLLSLRRLGAAQAPRHHPHQPLLLSSSSSQPVAATPSIHATRALHHADTVAVVASGSRRRNISTSSACPSSSPSSSPRRHRSAAAAAAPPPDAARAALEYCARLVRQHDPDSFAWAVLLPREERARVLALRALNVETLLVPSAVRGGGDGAAAMLRIRYQWWRDAVRAAMDAPAFAEAERGKGVEDTDEDEDEEEQDEQEEQEQKHNHGAAASPASEGRRRRSSRPPANSSPPPPPPPAHPVVTALWAARASAGPRLQRYPLRRLVDAREREALSAAAGEPPPLRLSDLEAHAEATHAQLLYAQLAAIGGGRENDKDSRSSSSSSSSAAADHAASHVGKAVGLAMALRGLPYAAAQRRCVLPLEACASAGLSQEDLFRRAAAIERGEAAGEGPASREEWTPRADAALRDAVLEVASRAVGHLEEARALVRPSSSASSSSSSFSKGQAHALLPAVAADLYLRSLERTAQFDVFHPALRPPPPPKRREREAEAPPPPPGAGLGVSPLRYLLSLRWHAWRGTF